jgi:hypothetical protein
MSVRPESCAGVTLQLPSGLRRPADRLAPSGRPWMVIHSSSEPSVSVSAAAMGSRMG